MNKLTPVAVTLTEGPQTVHLPAPGTPHHLSEHPTVPRETLLYALDTEQPSVPCLIYLSRTRLQNVEGLQYVDVRELHGQPWWLYTASPVTGDRVLH